MISRLILLIFVIISLVGDWMDVEEICSVLEDGGLIIIPTDTIYGIIGDAINIDTIIKFDNNNLRILREVKRVSNYWIDFLINNLFLL